MTPKISVIIPTFNRFKKLVYTLETIIAQTYEEFECIIVDDNNTITNTKLIQFLHLLNDDRFNYYVRPHHLKKGPSSCRNYGVEIAKGNYVQFFDDDDVMYEDMLYLKIKAIGDGDVAVSPLNYYDVKTSRIISQNEIQSHHLIYDYVTGKVSWYVSGPLWKKTFLKERFDEDIQTLDDWDFNLRNIYNTPKIKYINKPLLQYNRFAIGETLSTKSQQGDLKQLKSAFEVYKKHYFLLKENQDLDIEVSNFLFYQFLKILRTCLLQNYNKQAKHVFRILIQEFKKGRLLKIIKLSCGYYSYKIFGRGYQILKTI